MRIEAVPMEQICREVVKAATDVLKSHGIERPAVVVNVAWKEPSNGETYAIGTAVPKRHKSMMADSLAQSLEEATAMTPVHPLLAIAERESRTSDDGEVHIHCEVCYPMAERTLCGVIGEDGDPILDEDVEATCVVCVDLEFVPCPRCGA